MRQMPGTNKPGVSGAGKMVLLALGCGVTLVVVIGLI